ncbi:MAG: ParB family chromosome partitioning protein [Acidimicrobiales bacterium]
MNRRSGLGRGLGSLIPSEANADGSGNLVDIPVSAISANENQPRTRFDEEALVSLTDSIRELGVLQPILVRSAGEGMYELIAGERRWRAARRAGLPTIPAVVREVDDRVSLEQAIVENLHREDLNALEEAAAYQQLIDEFELTQDQVAKRVGKSRSAVSNTLRLFQLPGSVQKMVASGEMQAGHARALLGSPDRSFQERLARDIVHGGLNVRQVEERVRAEVSDEAKAAPSRAEKADLDVTDRSGDIGMTRPAGLIELEELLGNHLDTRVHVSLGKSKGRLAIDFADLEDLKRIYQLMMQNSAVAS